MASFAEYQSDEKYEYTSDSSEKEEESEEDPGEITSIIIQWKGNNIHMENTDMGIVCKTSTNLKGNLSIDMHIDFYIKYKSVKWEHIVKDPSCLLINVWKINF